jgi:hypothetical protein
MEKNRMISWQYFLDRTGMWTSALCAVHCIVVPALISMSAFSSLAFLHNEYMENVVLAISATIAASSLIPSYIKHHRKGLPIVILLFGFCLMGMSRLLVELDESVMTSLGAALVAVAHLLNFRYCKKFHQA